MNDADRLCRDPAMRWVVGDRAIEGTAASASQMGRFETEWLTRSENLAALTDLPGRWIDKVHTRRPPRIVVLDMDSSESPTYGEQEGAAYNGHFDCTCYHPLFVFNRLAMWSDAPYGRATCTAPTVGARCWSRWSLAWLPSTTRHAIRSSKAMTHPKAGGWCYIDEIILDLSDRATQHNGPIPRYY